MTTTTFEPTAQRDLATLRIGTRKSPLAMWQAEHVQERLRALHGIEATLVSMETKGDKILDTALAKVGGKGLFVKELEAALLDGRVDLCVHSTKDVPAELPEGTSLVAFPPRADARDCFAAPDGVGGRGGVRALPYGARVGTSSLRRQAQLLALRPDLEIVSVRGNVATRLSKVTELSLSCVVLACAGLDRLGYAAQITHRLEPDEMLPAVGQGILSLQARDHDVRTLELLAALDDADARAAVTAERAFLRALEGGCQVPIAGHAVVNADGLTLTGLVARPDGSLVVKAVRRGARADAARIGVDMAHEILGHGGRAILVQAGVLDASSTAGGESLRGRVVVVARDEAPDDALSRALTGAGAQVLGLPLMQTAAPKDGAPLEAAVRELGRYDVVAFASVTAVLRVAERLKHAGLDWRTLKDSALVCAVGKATAQALVDRGLVVDVVGDSGGLELFSALKAATSLHGKRALLPRAAGGRDELLVALREAGCTVDAVETYRSVELDQSEQRQALLAAGPQPLVLVTSPQRARTLARVASGVAVRVVAIGPTTAQAAAEAGLDVVATAASPDATGVVGAIAALA